MISRWPIRIRLTAAFTAMMALVLTGVAIGTLLSFRATYDESLDHTLTSRLQQLQTTASASEPQTADTAAQLLDAHTGAIVSGSPTLGGRPLLTPDELAAGAAGELRVDHNTATGLPGPVRILAGPIHHGTAPAAVGVVAASLAGRDAAVADLGEELECCDSGGRSGSIRRDELARGGGHDLSDPRPTAVGEDHALVRCRQRICPSRSP